MPGPDHRLGVGVSIEHGDLARSVDAFAGRHLTAEIRRASVEAEPARPQFWAALAEQGLLGLHLRENVGGQGGGLVELAVALEVIGRASAPGPYVSTVLASAVLDRVGGPVAEELLPGLADGSLCAGVGLTPGLTGRMDGSALVVAGTSGPVLGADLADVVLVPVLVGEIGATVRWVVLDVESVKVMPTEAIDVTRAAPRLTVDEVPTERVLAESASGTVSAASAVVLGAEAVGLASWCVQTAAEYAVTRVQFGRPIGQFQGVKHRCAGMAVALEKARAVVWDAARAFDEDAADLPFAAEIAAVLAPDGAVSAARDCIQVLGGIGFTWEHDAHLYFRRAVTLRALLGRGRDARCRVAELAVAGWSRPVQVPLPEEAEAMREPIRRQLEEIARLDPEQQPGRLGDEGWVLPHLAPPHGRGAGPLEQLVISEELERSGVALPELALAAWLMPSVALHGTEEQARDLVRPTLRGEVLWCQMFSEPEAGSDLASLRTAATKVEGGWRITGQKIWTSLAFLAEWGVLLARTDPRAPQHEGITYFVLPMDSPGVTVRPLREMSGGTLFSEVFLDDVFVPDSGVVGAPGQGWQVARGTLANERVALGKGNAMYASVDDLIDFARGRDDVDRGRLGELVAENQALRLLGGRAVLKQLSGADASTTASVAKYLSMEFGQQVADFCHAELGIDGLADELGAGSSRWIEQTLSSRAMTIYGGTTEIQLNVIAERMLGLPRDPRVGG